MNRIKSKLFTGVFVIVAGLWIVDGMQFIKICNAAYLTPWYSTNWMLHPVTNAALAIQPSKEYWTENGNKSERWLVRETEFSGKTFWTILKRNQIDGSPLERE